MRLLNQPFNLQNIFFILIFIFLFSCAKEKDTEPFIPRADYDLEIPTITGKTFYVDPINGSANGDGSSEKPWRTLQEVIDSGFIQCYKHTESYNSDSPLELVNEGAPVKGGDRLILRTGYHGHINLSYFMFEHWLTIEAEEGHKPVLSQIKIMGAFKKIYLKGLYIIKDSYQGDGDYWSAKEINRNSGSCVYFSSNDFWGKGSEIKLNNLTCKTTEDISGWTAQDWVEKSASGIGLRSVMDAEIFNCRIENISHGITIEYFSDHSSAVNNVIKNFSGDGSRIISNNVLFSYNTISDCFKVDDNHDDCIQSYSRGADNSPGTGVIKGVVIRGNLLIGTTDFSNQLAGAPQGIGCFDGFFDHWIVENNVVVTDHYHGISFYGFSNSAILNNTVVDQNPDNKTFPWIMIADHKDGRASSNCLLANNIVASSISVKGNNITESNNYVIGKSNYNLIYELFQDPDNFDFHILKNELTDSSIINKGSENKEYESSRIDKDIKNRNSEPDLGAFEFYPK